MKHALSTASENPTEEAVPAILSPSPTASRTLPELLRFDELNGIQFPPVFCHHINDPLLRATFHPHCFGNAGRYF
ncbi:MAG: hypothetical protein AAGF95_35655 [Chloroflexota bacterium]